MKYTNEDVAREFISYAVLTNKSGLIKVLEANGYRVPNNPSDKEITVAILHMQANPKFRKDLAAFLTSLATKAADHFKQFAGSTNFFGFDSSTYQLPELNTGPIGYTLPTTAPALNTGSQGTFTPQATDTTKKKTAVGSILSNIGSFLKTNVLTPDTVNGLLQAGLTSLNNKIQNKSNNIQAESNNLQYQQQAMLQNLPPSVTKKNNMVTYIFIGVGVLALGTIVYLMAKKN